MAMPSNLETKITEQRPALFVYVRGIVRDAVIAEDLTQESMLRAHRSAYGLKDDNCLVPWLYRIATNVCHDYFRKKLRIRENSQGSNIDLFIYEDLRDENAPRLDKV